MKPRKEKYDVVIIGQRPRWLACRDCSPVRIGADDVLIIERDVELGGILLQCIHNGFGLETFKGGLPGPVTPSVSLTTRSAWRGDHFWIRWCWISPPAAHLCQWKTSGFFENSGAFDCACHGLRERTRAQVRLPVLRPAGCVTPAGTAQRWVNVKATCPARISSSSGSGDIVQIMARRLTLEVRMWNACLEVMPTSPA
jgi:hypothetical protein